MKRIILAVLAMVYTMVVYAQTDTSITYFVSDDTLYEEQVAKTVTPMLKNVQAQDVPLALRVIRAKERPIIDTVIQKSVAPFPKNIFFSQEDTIVILGTLMINGIPDGINLRSLSKIPMTIVGTRAYFDWVVVIVMIQSIVFLSYTVFCIFTKTLLERLGTSLFVWFLGIGFLVPHITIVPLQVGMFRIAFVALCIILFYFSLVIFRKRNTPSE